MAAEQKSVSILLAVYNPRMEWFCELLDSLDRQTYPTIKLFVRDDASPDLSSEELEQTVAAHIHAFPYVIARNERNLGSNATFAALLEDADGDLVSFCDQDDVWLPEKVERTVRLLTESPLSPTAVCTELRIIDGEGNVISPNMRTHRKRHVFLRGEGLARELIFRNFVVGCTLVMERARAASYLPFPDGIIHDHYLAFRAACDGALDYLEEPQILYRVHGNNQTGVMTGVTTKEDYLRERILVFENRVARLSERVTDPILDEARAWCDARLRNFRREKHGFRDLRRLRRVNRTTTDFELYALRFPDFLFRFCIKKISQGKL